MREERPYGDPVTVQDRDLSVAQVAAVLRVSESTVRRIPRDLLPVVRTSDRGGWRRYQLAAVLGYAVDVMGMEPSAARAQALQVLGRG